MEMSLSIKIETELDQVNSANLLFELWLMDIVAIDIMIYEYWVFTGQYWLVFDGTESVLGDTSCNLVVLGSITRYWLVLSGTGLIKGFDACIYWKN